MNTRASYRKSYFALLCLSLVVHLLGFYAYQKWLSEQPEPSSSPAQTAVMIQLQPKRLIETPAQKQEESEKQAPEQTSTPEHLPTHNSDRFASNNQKDRTIQEVSGGGAPQPDREKAQQIAEAPEPNQAKGDGRDNYSESMMVKEDKAASDSMAKLSSSEQDRDSDTQKRSTANEGVARQITDSRGLSWKSTSAKKPANVGEAQEAIAILESKRSSESDMPEQGGRKSDGGQGDAFEASTALTIPSDFLNGLGNMAMLTNDQMSDAFVEQPFSEQQSKEIEMVNIYLERMNRQVRANWRNPYDGGHMYRGIITLELSVKGYLQDYHVRRSSGLHHLDQSVIDAILAVDRFLVPENEIIAARYYSRINIHYSSIETETELMPFEEQRLAEKDS